MRAVTSYRFEAEQLELPIIMIPSPMLLPQIPLRSADLEPNTYYYVQPKYDGVRCKFHEGRPYSRSGKEFPNVALREALVKTYADSPWRGLDLDGEIMLWNPATNWWAPFNSVQSWVMTKMSVMDAGTATMWRYVIFDAMLPRTVYHSRWQRIVGASEGHSYMNRFLLAPTDWTAMALVEGVCNKYIALGYEGAVVRNPYGNYKNGRATYAQHNIYKWVEWLRAEARVVGWEELQHNLDTSTSRIDNMLASDMLGALVVESEKFGRFNIGTGFTEAQRRSFWVERASLTGRVVTFKYRPGHVKIAPCPAVFVGFRSAVDM